MNDWLNRLARKKLPLAAVASLLFNNWLLGLFVNWKLIKKGGSISELSSAGQPAHWLFQGLDVVAGIAIVVLALALSKHIDLRRKSGQWIVGSLVVLGIANIADAFMPLPCSGTLDPRCSSPVHLGLHGFSIPTHAISSSVIGICFLLLPLLSLAYFRGRRYAAISTLVTILATLIFFGSLLVESLHGSYSGSASAGYTQEIQMLVFGGWLILMARSSSHPES